ncbi:hypothetical protein M422DRAFT_158218 [Sphaerobolus stellatus SS14]|nr:hypothetical protein M422DRAFT_158218 [Sphaerobolus stellatus SS14]
MSSVPGVLHVLTNLGQNLTLEEFDDWYDNEHGPDRLRLSGFRAGTRYEATDAKTPRWAASYELDDIGFLKSPSYLHLMQNRSEREKIVLSKLETLDRRIYRLLYSKGHFEPSPGSDAIIVTVNLRVPLSAASEVEEWYTKEHVEMLSRVSGWYRTQFLRQEEPKEPAGFALYLAIHEYSTVNGLKGPEHAAAVSTPWRMRVMSDLVEGGPHRRTYSLYHVFTKQT